MPQIMNLGNGTLFYTHHIMTKRRCIFLFGFCDRPVLLLQKHDRIAHKGHLYYILDHTIWFSKKSIFLQCQWTDCPAKMKIPMPMESLVLYIFPL
jgi:hypothetical protein